jgi:hypothetical protein
MVAIISKFGGGVDKSILWLSFAQQKWKLLALWRRGAVNIASTRGTRRPGFEFRQGIRFFEGNIAVQVCINDLICIVCVLKKINEGI